MKRKRNLELVAVAAAALLVPTGVATADPYGAVGQLSTIGHLSGSAVSAKDCDALRRSAALRARLKPSERREMIKRCELEASLASARVTVPDPNPTPE